MTTAEQLLLKLQTGHGPFRKTSDQWLIDGHMNHAVMLCECHGFRWCADCLTNWEHTDYGKNYKDGGHFRNVDS